MNINSSQPINSNQLHPFQGPEGRKDEFQEEVYGCEACSSSARYGSRTRPLRNLKANKTRPYQGCVSLCCCPLPLQSPEAVLHSRTAEISAMFNHSQDLESISCRFIYLSSPATCHAAVTSLILIFVFALQRHLTRGSVQKAPVSPPASSAAVLPFHIRSCGSSPWSGRQKESLAARRKDSGAARCLSEDTITVCLNCYPLPSVTHQWKPAPPDLEPATFSNSHPSALSELKCKRKDENAPAEMLQQFSVYLFISFFLFNSWSVI